MPETYYLTQERFDELKAELERLKADARSEIAEQLKKAKEYGDLSENAEYAEAREEQARVESRIFELENMMKHAVIIKKEGGSDAVQIGGKATVRKDGKTFEYTIVGSSESKPEEGKISNESPIGRALLGRKVGDSVTITTPAGSSTYQITKIE